MLRSNSSTELVDALIAADPLDSFSALLTAVTVVVRFLGGLWLLPWIIAAPVAVFMLFFRTLPGLFDPKRKPLERLSSSVWTIHGRKYDLSSWAKKHPGGEWAINLGCNRDCTGLFESYHVFADRKQLEKLLARFEILSDDDPLSSTAGPLTEAGTNQTGLIFNDEFHEDVKHMVRSHFHGKSHKMKPWVVCSVALMLCAEVLCVYYYFKGSTLAMFLLPFVGSQLASILAHDGSHFAVSERPWINSLASLTGMPICFASTCWSVQHVVQHHVYTNDEDDVDLYHFLPVCRTSRFTRWSSRFKLQWLAIFLVLPTTVGHLLFTVPIDLLSGQLDAITGSRRYEQCQNLDDFVARSKRWILGEMFFCLSFIAFSIHFHGWLDGLRKVFIVYSISSFEFVIMTQGAHLHGECMVGKEDQFRSWAKRQAATSVNFCPSSSFWSFVTGGLNFQSLHHVVPGIGGSHFPDLYPEYKKLCEKHGVPLKESKDIMSFFQGFLRWIQELARNDEQ